MPAFVYLVPFLALFAASRFTAIAAAVVYACPWHEDRRRRRQGRVGDNGRSGRGLRVQQLADHHQGAAADVGPGLTLATNQGLIYVLSMVVVGGLVGAGALGYDVVAGFSRASCTARDSPPA